MKAILYLLGLLILSSCNNIDVQQQQEISALSENIFKLKQIDTKQVISKIESVSEKILPDTTKYKRKDTKIYINSSARTSFQVSTYKEGKIWFIAFYKNGKEINGAEYYRNGIIKCKFNVTPEGLRDGQYECYHENGSIRQTGQYLNDRKIGEEVGYDAAGNIIYRHQW